MPSYEVKGLPENTFIAHLMLKSWIISCPPVKLTILSGHDPTFAPKILACVLQHCTLNDYLANCSPFVRPPGAHQMLAWLVFQRYSGPKRSQYIYIYVYVYSRSYGLQCPV